MTIPDPRYPPRPPFDNAQTGSTLVPAPVADIAAAPDCEHYWAYHLRGGSPLSVRACQSCHAIDFDDLDDQAAALIEQWARTPRSQQDPRQQNGSTA